MKAPLCETLRNLVSNDILLSTNQVIDHLIKLYFIHCAGWVLASINSAWMEPKSIQIYHGFLTSNSGGSSSRGRSSMQKLQCEYEN